MRPRAALLRGAAITILAATVFAAAPNPTGGIPGENFTNVAALPVPAASLQFEESQPVITGSVSFLFADEMFAGPNRSEKRDRAMPRVDVAEFAESFTPLWTQVAAQRLPIAENGIAVASAAGDAPVTVASVDPGSLGIEGLAAIDSLTDPGLDPSIPRPVSVPDALAFGRSTAPATDFTPQHDYSEREQWCLATGVYFEARGESYRGQVAVAQVIMNRVEDYRYPDTICGVVYQNQSRRNACQFSFACDGIPDRITEPRAWALAQEVTQEVLNGDVYLTEVADSTHYHANYVRPAWAGNMDRLTQIGLHIFYRFRPGWRFG